jgi:hypothetical protein
LIRDEKVRIRFRNTVLLNLYKPFINVFKKRFLDPMIEIQFLLFLQCGGSGMFIPDPDADFLPSGIPDLGVKKVPNPGTLIQSRNSVFLYVDFGSTESVAS